MNNDFKSCCTPQRTTDTSSGSQTGFETPVSAGSSVSLEVCDIPGGSALVGTDAPIIAIDEESPCRRVTVKPFRMLSTAVTNSMFKQFVQATGYRTEAEKLGWSFVFFQQLPNDFKATQAVANTQWWRKVDGAYWQQPCGPDASTEIHDDHPVIHVSWNDATAYAKWVEGRLPSETEWEHAARGGLKDVPFPWGRKAPDDSGYYPCNIWQGAFPEHNTAADGFHFTAPARSYEPNGYGLYNMCGNVWEWTSGRIKINGRSPASRQHAKHYKGCKLLKGGSFLCHKSYCYRYRISARTGNTPDSTTTHQGFRVVFDV
jgi:formylglycine-generating enzyme required for sulfatase activity